MGQPRNRRSWVNSLTLMVLVGLALRLALTVCLQLYDLNTAENLWPFSPPELHHFGFGYETGAIAYSLATGHGFSSPFGGSTGPTAWLAPLYPAICALVFKGFGCFTLASGFVILLINSVLSALTCIPILRIGELTMGRKVGCWSGWIWAAGVYFMFWPTQVWETSASALLASILVLQSLQLAKQSSGRRWAIFGLVWGIAALTNPALLAFLPAAGLYPAVKLWRRHQRWFAHAALSAVIFAAAITPWLIRNRVVLGSWVFIRSNAPFEFYLGNYHGSNGMGWFGKHPTANKWEYARYKRMGELAYIADKKQLAVAFVRQHPQEFAALCATRALAFWRGTPLNTETAPPQWFYWLLAALMLGGLVVAIIWHVDGGWLYFWLIFLYPVTYYLAFPQPRNRHAIEPVMLLLSTYFVSLALKDLGKRILVKQRSRAELRPVSVGVD